MHHEHTPARKSGLVAPQAPPCGLGQSFWAVLRYGWRRIVRRYVWLLRQPALVPPAGRAPQARATSWVQSAAGVHSAVGCRVNLCARLQLILHLPLLAQFTAVRSCLQSALLSGLPSSDCPRGQRLRSQRRTALHPCCGYVPCCVNLPYCRANVTCRCADVPCCGAISPCCCPNAPCCCPNAPCCAKVPCARGARFA